MRFLLDAHVPTDVATALLESGHDVARSAFVLPDALDETILALAVAEQRILITWDRDYSELVFYRRAPAPPAIIYIRLETHGASVVLPRLAPLLDFTKLADHMTIIDPDATRRRPFPRRAANG